MSTNKVVFSSDDLSKVIVKRIYFESSKRGLPTFSEVGGGMTNTGYATGIANSFGQKKKPIYSPNKLYCAKKHNIFVIEHGDIIAEAQHDRTITNLHLYKVFDFDFNTNEVLTVLIADYVCNQNTMEKEFSMLFPNFEDFGYSIIQKSFCYHCRHNHYSL